MIKQIGLTILKGEKSKEIKWFQCLYLWMFRSAISVDIDEKGRVVVTHYKYLFNYIYEISKTTFAEIVKK